MDIVKRKVTTLDDGTGTVVEVMTMGPLETQLMTIACGAQLIHVQRRMAIAMLEAIKDHLNDRDY